MIRNDAGDFAADTVWIATMATWGDLIRVPTTLYHKRYHDENVHSVWMAWDRNQRFEAWIVHCHDLLEVSTRVSAQPADRWLLWLATVSRLVSSRATPYLPWAELTDSDRITMIDQLIARIQRLGRIDLVAFLAAPWTDIRRRSMEHAMPAC
jgi:hypothetical protein